MAQSQFDRSRARDHYLYAKAHEQNPLINDPVRYGWESLPHMQARYEAIFRLLGLLSNKPANELTIFDFGCGTGQLIKQMNKRGVGRAYYGIDGYQPNIDQFFPTPGAEAWCTYWDGQSELPFDPETVDVVVETGAFSTMPPDIRAKMFLALIEMPKLAFIGTFLQPSVAATPRNGIVAVRPGDMLSLIDETRYKYALLVDYIPWDFALWVYKEPEYNLQIQ